MDKFRIIIEFLPHPKTRKRYELKSIRLKTKPTTWKQAQEIALNEVERTWPHNKITIKRLR